jgi:hypothetical protein
MAETALTCIQSESPLAGAVFLVSPQSLQTCADIEPQTKQSLLSSRLFSSENVSQITYLGTTVTNRNLIQEEIKTRVKCDNACCHPVQNLLSSSLLSKKRKH